MISKSIVFCLLIVATISYAAEDSKESYAAEDSKECSNRLLDDSELSRWDISAPQMLLQSKQNIVGPTNVMKKSYLSAELAGTSDGKWKVQMYETIKKEMYVQDNNRMRWIAESVLGPKLPINDRSVIVDLSDNEVRHDTSIYAGKKYILAQLEYKDLDLILNGDKTLDGPYVKKKVYVASDMRSGAITMSFVGQSIDKDKKLRRPTATRFFEIQGDEWVVIDDKCSTGDVIYSFANIDSDGNLVAYFGFEGYHAVVRCDKKDILRYLAILAEQTSSRKDFH